MTNPAKILKMGGEVRSLASNSATTFLDASRMWIVHSGTIELVGAPFEGAKVAGHTRSLFRVPSGGPILGMAPSESAHGLLGVASGGEVVIEEVSLPVSIGAKELEPGWTSLFDEWSRDVSSVLVAGREMPTSVSRLDGSGSITLYNKDVFSSDPNETMMLLVRAGQLCLTGIDKLTLQQGEGVLLSPDAWLEVSSEQAEIDFWPLAESTGQPELLQTLLTLQRLFGGYLRDAEQVRAANEAAMYKRSSEQIRMKSEAAFSDLADVLNPRERFSSRETDLLTAASIVGESLAINITAPFASEDLTRVADPLDAIARASRVRSRMVLLGYDWDTRDTGPLVAYLEEEGERVPVALLPYSNGYEFVHPRRLQREPVTDEVKNILCPDAYSLYRILPDQVNGVLDLLRFTAHGRFSDVLFILLVGVAATLLGMVVPKATGTLVDSAIPYSDFSLLWQLALVLLAAGVAQVTFIWVQMMTTVRAGMLSEINAQSAMWDRILKFRPTFFRQYSSGDLQSRASAVSEISRELSGAALRPLVSGVLAVLNLGLLAYYSAELAQLAILIGAVVLLITLVVGHYIRQLSWVLHDLEGSFKGLVIQMVGAVPKLRVAGAEQRAFNHWVANYTEQLRLKLGVQRLQDFITVFNSVLIPICSMFLFWKSVGLIIGVPSADQTALSTGDFIAFNAAFMLYLKGWSDVSNTVVSVLDAVVKGRRIKPLLDGRPEVSLDAVDPGRLRGHLCLENVSFRYAEEGPLTLDNISCEIQPGEFVAFVGPSGSGKSTILRLLLGFEECEQGRILFDGQDLSGLDVLAVRRQIGTVLQHGRLNTGSIFENISNNSKISHAEAWEAIADAGMTSDLENMPMGLHTMVAEGGGNLSGGQRQRLLIARALATRPKIVFFDEATSALDNKTQSIVSSALTRRKVTRVVIAHRLSTIQSADKIYVLNNGRLIQSGGFKELSENEGFFRNLVMRQLA